jgi:hypothetical protein
MSPHCFRLGASLAMSSVIVRAEAKTLDRGEGGEKVREICWQDKTGLQDAVSSIQGMESAAVIGINVKSQMLEGATGPGKREDAAESTQC